MYSIFSDGIVVWFQGTDDPEYLATNIKLQEEVNTSGSLEFILPPDNLQYSNLQKMKSTITVEDDGVEFWRGRILHDEKDFYNCKHIFCEGQLSFLMDSIIRPYSSTLSVEDTFNAYLTTHNEQVNANRQITKGNVTVTDPNDYLPRSSTGYPKTLDEIKEKLVNSLGGYLIFRLEDDTWYLDYKIDYGRMSDQVITFGKNLLDVTEYISAENLFTVLIPLGATIEGTDEKLTIESVNDGLDYIENATAINLFGRITAVNEWNDVTVASNLLTKGQEYLLQNIELSTTLTIKAVDLHYLQVDTDKIMLGDYVRVVSPPHDLDTYFLCSKITHDLEDPSKDEFVLGTLIKTMTDQQVEMKKKG